jgi:hypothetical protein
MPIQTTADRLQTTDIQSALCPQSSVIRSVPIRKTSLLHKIDPTARRSSFADMRAAGDLSHERPASQTTLGDSAPPVTCVTRSAWIDLLFTMSDNTRRRRQGRRRAQIMILTNELSGAQRPPSLKLRRATFAVRSLLHQPQRPWPRRLVEPDGIEPTTSCLQSRRSPN